MENNKEEQIEKEIPVKAVKEVKSAGVLVDNTLNQSLAPETTKEQDITTAGQRAINLIWENTQSRIALIVICVGLLTNLLLIITVIILAIIGKDINAVIVALISTSLSFINLIAGIVIGFYFSRTNHTKTGGVEQGDKGR